MTRRLHLSVGTIRLPVLIALTCMLVAGSAAAGPDTGSTVTTTSPQSFTTITRHATLVIPSKNTTTTASGLKLSSYLRHLIETNHKGTSGEDDRVYVYIHVITGVSTHSIDPLALDVTDRDETSHIAAAWVAVSRLEDLAALPDVISVKEILPPVPRSQDGIGSQAALTTTPGTSVSEQTTSAESKQAMPAQSPGLLLPGVLAALAIHVVIKSRLHPR